MNIVKNLIQKIEERRKETKEPCKNYATYEAAENAAKKAAKEGAEHFGVNDINYLVFYNPWWERYCVAFDLTAAMAKSSVGGYLPFLAQKGFYSY